MQQRRGTASQWTSADPILAAGEIGFETDTGFFKIGDGTNIWSDLSYFKDLGDLAGSFDDYVPLTQKGAANGVATLDGDSQIPLIQLTKIINGAPEALDTLNELAYAVDAADGLVANKINDALSGKILVSTGLSKSYDAGTDELTISLASSVATDTEVSTAVSDHNSVTTNVHGISDTADLVYATDLSSGLSAKQDKVTGVSDTEIGYLDGVTSGIQSQINGKAASSHTHAQSDITDLASDLALKAPLADPTFTGTVNAASLILSGDLTVGGTTTTVNATNLVVEDSLIYIGEGNSANTIDLGLVSSFNDGTYQHSGIVRDSSAGTWKLFKGVTDEPTTTVNFSQGSLDDLALNNLTAAGIVFTDGTQVKQGVPSITTINQQTSGYTTVLTDRDKLVEVSSASGVTVTIPANSSVAYPVGTSIDILQTGAGQVTIAGAGGVTVNATPGLKLRTQWSSATLFKRATDTWVVFGDLSA